MPLTVQAKNNACRVHVSHLPPSVGPMLINAHFTKYARQLKYAGLWLASQNEQASSSSSHAVGAYVSPHDVVLHCCRCGVVKSVTVHRDEAGASKGTAVVEFNTPFEASMALALTGENWEAWASRTIHHLRHVCH